MVYILVGLLGFLMVLASDGADLGRAHLLGLGLRIVGFLLVALAFLGLGLTGSRLSLGPWLRIPGAALSLLFFGLFCSSFWTEVPQKAPTAAAGGHGLVTTGSYALVRHPGLLWLLALHL
ncbi:MAG TPA: hypothetical protein VFL04_05635, partial [Rectinemataceae bacterium]|nr:hypothetical protein [Rectinemataceae bacterium]